MWEMDWTKRKTVGRYQYVWARNPSSKYSHSRDWHWTNRGTITKTGIPWQKIQGTDKGWEVDWDTKRRNGTNTQVWARNLKSFQKRSRDWHWTSRTALAEAGVKWQSIFERRTPTGRSLAASGYVILHKMGMTETQIALADRLGLWIGHKRGRRHGLKEHQLIAAEIFGGLPKGFVVRHLNGNKSDNRPENLLLGTRLDNSCDHHSAVRDMMYWRQRALLAEGKDLIEVLSSR